MRIYSFLLLIIVPATAFCQIDYNNFLGKKSTITYSKQYTFANLYDYKIDAKAADSLVVKTYGFEVAEESLIRKYNQLLALNTVDSVLFKIVLRARLILEIDNVKHAFIKYKLVTNGVAAINFDVIDLINQNGLWSESIDTNMELEAIKFVFSALTIDTFYAFYNKRDDPKQPEINKLKSQVKNDAGVLDIKLMERVIKQHKAELAKYLE